ncbi:hypothetical protein F3157_09775 [Virgibacillus dakarensis]|uniref:hypothetical protein n=1 Tax=Virgibacillus dakarensis TaxID=1917889 RepID=UPI000B44DE0A|nr:hypothetical protein [Virgibacillus dakarensis]MBT2214230.1 hypothetical protein [Virgibacillus dakarensis]MTW85945.1 hypothetical protein [Virgibacillus dakarensis]
MTIAARRLSYSNNGMDRQTFANSLQQISDQLRWVDQKLTMKVDNEIVDAFYSQQKKINKIQANINHVK